MAYRKKVVKQEIDDDGNVKTEEVAEELESDFKPVGEAVPISVASSGRGEAAPIPIAPEPEPEPEVAPDEVSALREEVERLRMQVNDLPFEEALKSKYFGTRMYLTVTRFARKDPRNPAITRYTKVALSVFPDAVDRVTGQPLAPDIGFDNRKQADAMRNSDDLIDFEGEEIPIKEAVKRKQREYFNRRREGDRLYLERASSETRRA